MAKRIKLESKYQADLIKKIESRFPGCEIQKNDSSYKQGFPDLTILYGKHWAVLEVKRDKNAPHQPNQDYYVSKLDSMSFSRFICPENEEEVLDELYKTFKS